MLKLLPLLALVSLQSLAAPLSRTPQKMYNYIYKNHLFRYHDHRFVGSWKTNIYFKQSFNLLSLEENSFFVPIFIMQTLDEINHTHELSGIDKLKESFLTYADGFLNEARENSEPPGTINYWRSYPTANGPHYFPKDPAEFNLVERLVLNLRNIPNDLDGSAQMCDWLIRTNHPEAKDYCLDMVNLLSSDTYVDTVTKPQSVFDDKWKRNGSGAFLTWATTDKKRMPYNANDVDCTVNLNILNAFNTVSETYSKSLLNPVARHLDNVCAMVQDVVIKKKSEICSPYYDGTSFYWAFSKYYKNSLTRNCFEKVADQVRDQILSNALKFEGSLIRNRFSKGVDTVDVAETLVAMYNMDMHKIHAYSFKTKRLMKTLLEALLNDALLKGDQLNIKEGFAFRGIIHLAKSSGKLELTGLWKSSYLATVLTLQAYLNYQKINE